MSKKPTAREALKKTIERGKKETANDIKQKLDKGIIDNAAIERLKQLDKLGKQF